jgi:hypothetical protein
MKSLDPNLSPGCLDKNIQQISFKIYCEEIGGWKKIIV